MNISEQRDLLLQEIKINKPINKKDLIYKIIKIFGPYILMRLSESSNINEFENEWHDMENADENDIMLINQYFNNFKLNDIWVTTFSEHSINKYQLPKSYKTIEGWFDNDDRSYILLHNL